LVNFPRIATPERASLVAFAMGGDTSVIPVFVILIALLPLASAGLALINAGFGRARGAAHAMVSSFAAMAIAAILYCLVGCSLEGHLGGPAKQVLLGGKPWDWIADEPFLMRGFMFNGSPATLAVLLQIFTVGIAALIPISTGADRWRLRSICISTALLAGWSYPLFAHWVWGGGWLAQLGSNLKLGHGFLDAGGASTVQVVGGLSALTIAWTLGPRRGKYIEYGGSAAIPGHNIVYVLFGCALAVPGWIALNSAGAILFAGAAPSRIPLVAAATMLSASASCLVSIVVTRIRYGKPDASLCANGWLGGLVASSAICCFVTPQVAIVVGLVAGLVVTISVEVLEVLFDVDDPGGAISVHAVAGIWGLLAVGIFPRIPYPGDPLQAGSQGDSGQLLAQVVGIATLLGLILPLMYALNLLLNRIDPQRVDYRAERLGMDLHELGGGAYPEFVMHRDE
jgi:Amt family ammonium transporter